MAKPNYAFEKRQRELEKKHKKEDKALRKASQGTAPEANRPDTQPGEPPAAAAPDRPAP